MNIINPINNQNIYNMTHECKVQCYSVDPKTAELTGIDDDGKWLPFIFNMDIIDAAKASSDDEDSVSFNCTTIYTTNGNTFIIDTPYTEFFKKFMEYNDITFIDPSDDNLDL
jgi:hypothetical protein